MRHRYAWSTILLLLFVMMLALPEMDTSLWTDEQRTLWYAGAAPQYGPIPLTQNIDRVAENLWQAPGYFIVMAGWGRVFGWGAFPMRVFSLLVGLLAVAVTYRVGRELFSGEVGFYAAFTLAMGAFYINFLHDMRTYSLNVLLTALMLWAYWRLITARKPLGWYLLLSFSTAGLLYTHYFNGFAVAALGLYHLLVRFRKPRSWQVMACFAVAGVAFMPWLGVLVRGAQNALVDDRVVANLSPLHALNDLLAMFANESQALLVLLVLVAVGWPVARRESRWFVVFWAGAALLLAVISTRFVPILTEIKYLIFMFPVLAIGAGVGVARLHRLGISPLILLGLWGALALWNLQDAGAQERIQARDWQVPLRELTDALQGRTLPQDAVIFHLAEGAEEANRNEMMDYYMHPFDILNGELIPANDATPDELYFRRVREAVDGSSRVWLGYEQGRRSWRVGPTEQQVLPGEGYTFCGAADDTALVHLALFAQAPNAAQAITFTTQDEQPIDVYVLNAPYTREAASLEVNMGWDVSDDLLPGFHSLGIHIEDADGAFVTGSDYGMPTNGFGCVLANIPLSDMPAGTYTVRAVVYNWDTGERLRVSPAVERPVVGTFDWP